MTRNRLDVSHRRTSSLVNQVTPALTTAGHPILSTGVCLWTTAPSQPPGQPLSSVASHGDAADGVHACDYHSSSGRAVARHGCRLTSRNMHGCSPLKVFFSW